MGRRVFDFPFNPKTHKKIMKFSNISKATRVPASLKFVALAAFLLVPAGMFAGADSDYSRSLGAWERSVDQRTGRSKASASRGQTDNSAQDAPWAKTDSETQTPSYFSVKAFYGLGLKDPVKGMDRAYSDPEIDVSGLTIEYTRGLCSYVDFVSAVNVGAGARNYSRNGTGYEINERITIATLEAEVGLNLSVPIYRDRFSLFAGPRFGVNLLYVKASGDSEDSDDYEEDWDKNRAELGVLFGGDVGAVISFSESSALVLGVGYRRSTARPFADMEEQAWVRFSAGCRFAF